MSDSENQSQFPAILGISLVVLTTVVLLVGLGVFGTSLLGAMFNPVGEDPQVEGPASTPPGSVVNGASAAPVPAVKDKAPASSTPPAAPAAPSNVSDAELAKLMESGKQTFLICAACHGPEGKTLIPNMAPNMAGSEYLNGPSERLAMLVLNGIQYPGKYLGQMVAWKAQLTDEQIAGILTYARNSFGNSAPAITTDQIAWARKKYADRDTPFSREELDQVTDDLPAPK